MDYPTGRPREKGTLSEFQGFSRRWVKSPMRPWQAAHGSFKAMTWLTWSLLSALFAAATAILAKLGVTGVDANVATAVRTSVVVLSHVDFSLCDPPAK